MKKLLVLITIATVSVYAPPKKVFNTSRKTTDEAHVTNQNSTEENINQRTKPTDLVFIQPKPESSSSNFLREETEEFQTKRNSLLIAPPSSPLANNKSNNNDDDDETEFTDFVVTTDMSDVNVKPHQTTQTWTTVLYEKYYKIVHEQCAYQRFCKLVGAKKKYAVLDELCTKGQLTNYIEELNSNNIGTGNSLLNEALCEAIHDDQSDIIIKLLSEASKYIDGLSIATKKSLNSFLLENNNKNQDDISKEVSEYLERMRLTTKIIHMLNGTEYNGPNYLTIASAAQAYIATLTDAVKTDTLAEKLDVDKKLNENEDQK